MGWFGNGKYDGDGTASVQMTMIEEVGYAKNIPLKNSKKTIDEAYAWYVGKETLADEVVIKVFKSWDKLEKILMKNSDTEEKSICYMMAADFFMNHNAIFPQGLKDKALKALDYLIDVHSEDFNNPAARKKVLRNFKEKLGLHPEFSIIQTAKPKM